MSQGMPQREIDANKHAWGQISRDHYEAFKQKLAQGTHVFNPYIRRELGDLSGKKIIHLQCNVGADTILLARMGASAMGVDLVPDNVRYAQKLADDFGVANASFMACDIMELADRHSEQYDVVFVSEGAVGWLPDLDRWGRTIRGLLRPGGFVYVFDSHPFVLTFNTEKLAKEEWDLQYPYFGKTPDEDDSIGGYASEPRQGVKAYFWMYTVSDLINAFASRGMRIDFFNEYKENFFDAGGLVPAGEGLFNYPFNTDKLPMSFSLKATVL